MQSCCFLASSRLRMAIASFLTAASDMRCLWCTSKERVLRRVVVVVVPLLRSKR